MKEETEADVSRRKFFVKAGLALGALAAVAVAIPVVGALIGPLLQKKVEVWRILGRPSDFETGMTILVHFTNADPAPYAGVTAESAAWLRKNTDNDFIAFSVNCSHLGCPVRWEKNAELFMCPCHGGVYYKDGTVAAGPPPQGLTQYKVRVYNGQVQLLTAPLPLTSINAS